MASELGDKVPSSPKVGGAVDSAESVNLQTPWQYEWKRPQWTRVQELDSDKKQDESGFQKQKRSNKPRSKLTKHRPLCHSTCAVVPEEIIRDQDQLEALGILGQVENVTASNNNDINSNNNQNCQYFLSATLMIDDHASNTKGIGTSKQHHRAPLRQGHITYADSILLELVRHEQRDGEEAVQEQVFSRHLRWPESALFVEEEGESGDMEDLVDHSLKEEEVLEEEKETIQEKETPKKAGLFGLGWGLGNGPAADKTQQQIAWKPKTSGIISACLCRLPPKDPNQHVTDAIDVVQLLSLGALSPQRQGPVKGAPTKESEGATLVTNENRPGQEPTESSTQSEESRLVLCCLHSRGKVYVYSPQELMQSPTARKKKQAQDDLDGEMASLFLGGAMLETLQDSYLPLTEPTETIRLAVPLMRSRKLVSPHPFDTASTQQLLDASIWDNTVDGPSLRFRTKDNIPCLLVYAFDVLCVAGPGRRVRKRKDAQDPNANLNTGHEDGNNSVDHSGSPSGGDHESGTLFSDGSTLTGAGTHVTATSAAMTALHLPSSGASVGGFVTFLSLRNFSTIKTVYLPFAPTRVSPFQWGYMRFLLVLGEGGFDKSQTIAVAIRVDNEKQSQDRISSTYQSSMVQVGKAPPPTLAEAINNAIEDEIMTDNTIAAANGFVDEKKFVSIRRFQILPIALDGVDEAPTHVVGPAPTSNPPSMALVSVDNHAAQMSVSQQPLFCINQISSTDEVTGIAPHPLFAKYRAAKAPTSGNATGTGNQRVLIRIETRCEPRLVSRIPLPGEVHSGSAIWCHQGQGWAVIGGFCRKAMFVSWEGATSARGAFAAEIAELEEGRGGQDCTSLILPRKEFADLSTLTPRIHMPNLERHAEEKALPGLFVDENSDAIDVEKEDEQDLFLMDAISSISPASYRRESNIHMPGTPRGLDSFSHQEKSERLLKRCSSWNILEHSDDTRQNVNLSTPVVSLRYGSQAHTLSLRSNVVIEQYQQVSTPFHHVMSWLGDKGDYFTAASLALYLLGDTKILHHLWTTLERSCVDDEASRFRGLLDGVEPIGASPPLRSIADMAVACLTKGGFPMSSTLRMFLADDDHYDSSRASLMLAAATAKVMSGDPGLVSSGMGLKGSSDDTSPDDVLWPVRCLLQVGVSRDTLNDTLILINATIPDELRHRRRGNVLATSAPSMELCTQLVSLILSTTPESATLLLSLIDEQSSFAYWNSLDDATQMALATIRVDGSTPLLHEEEVRSWVLRQLRDAIQNESSTFKRLPDVWLKELVWVCFESGGCDVVSLRDVAPEEKETDDEWGILYFSRSIMHIRNVLTAATSTLGIDYDIIISALLLLENRGESWCHEKTSLSTQNLLNASCYSSGRCGNEEPLFPLDGSTLMSLCYVSGNMQAGANLVGGQDGLTLDLVQILVHSVNIDVDEAEHFLCSDEAWQNKEDTDNFEITDWHRQTLALLEQHVVQVRTFGDFGSGLRGTVDPVFAARACLRTWLRLNSGNSEARNWFVGWLIERLQISQKAESPHRLACAAFARALIWPDNSEASEHNVCLAEQLDLPEKFVIQLSHACCGLVEAIP